MTIEITDEQAVYLKLLISVFTKNASTGVNEAIAKTLAEVAFKIERDGF